jgi:glutaredoxin
MVTIYTSFGWGPCVATKSWLKKHKIEYIEKDVGDDSIKDEILALGYRTTPIVVVQTSASVARGTVEGTQTIVGYSPTKLSEVLL